MSKVQQVVYSLRSVGITGTLAKAAGTLFEKSFDRKYGTDTCSRSNLSTLTITGESRAHATARYEPTRVLSLRKLLPIIRKMAPPESVLLDLGCGKGRVVLLAAEAGFDRARGVEFAAELCEVARRNCSCFKAHTGSHTEFEISHSDVALYSIRAEENVFFLFNPFDALLFDQVLSKIIASWRNAPRDILIVILLPTVEYCEAIRRRAEITFVRGVRSWGYDFCVYRIGGLHVSS